MANDSRGRIWLGTCSWSTKDWVGTVYSPGTAQADYIAEYAQRYGSVEVDSTFYGTPRPTVVEGWRDRTPESFIFAVKAPQVITHEKLMAGCERDVEEFLDTMALLGPRLGPVLFQFPYFAKRRGVTQQDFLDRLAPFLDALPQDGIRYAVEVRNKAWVTPRLLDLLRAQGVALALTDHPWMYRPQQWFRLEGIVTAPFTYIRWLGDRKGIEEITTTWNQHVVDREKDLEAWLPGINGLLDGLVDVYGYVNSHYSGYAPGDVDRLIGLLRLRGAGDSPN